MKFDGSALISPDGLYRYHLTREWASEGKHVLWIMLNPSTADAQRNDSTVKKCIGFTSRNGYKRLVIVNLFAFRTTFPDELDMAIDPIGPDNDATILGAAMGADAVICAWGVHGNKFGRDKQVIEILRKANVLPKCLALTKERHPGHPLMLAYTHSFIPFDMGMAKA